MHTLLNTIITETASLHNMSVATLLSKSRKQPLPTIRAFVCKYAYELHGFKLREIRDALQFKDHTTVISAKQTLTDEISVTPELYSKYQNYINYLNNALLHEIQRKQTTAEPNY